MLNAVMLFAIPPTGGHYLVDMLAGGTLALGAIAIQRAQRHGVSRVLLALRRKQTMLSKTNVSPEHAMLEAARADA